MLIMMAGLPGTGKSTLSRALAERAGGIVLEKDVIRATLFTTAHVEYSRRQDDFCQSVMLQAAEYLLLRDPRLWVFLDGRPFLRAYQRLQVEETAARISAPLAIIECVCAEATALGRLDADNASGVHPAANRGPSLYARVKAEFEPLTEPRFTVDTGQSLTECVKQAESYLRQVTGCAAS